MNYLHHSWTLCSLRGEVLSVKTQQIGRMDKAVFSLGVLVAPSHVSMICFMPVRATNYLAHTRGASALTF